MAEGIVKKQLTGFMSKTAVTLPYLFEDDGILVIDINPNNSANGAYVILNDGTSHVFVVPSGGTSGTFCLPVIKNTRITEGGKGNCKDTYPRYTFFKLA